MCTRGHCLLYLDVGWGRSMQEWHAQSLLHSGLLAGHCALLQRNCAHYGAISLAFACLVVIVLRGEWRTGRTYLIICEKTNFTIWARIKVQDVNTDKARRADSVALFSSVCVQQFVFVLLHFNLIYHAGVSAASCCVVVKVRTICQWWNCVLNVLKFKVLKSSGYGLTPFFSCYC